MSRDLKQMCDCSKYNDFLFQGKYNIVNALKRLPTSEHDPYTFSVDLLIHTVRILYEYQMITCRYYNNVSFKI